MNTIIGTLLTKLARLKPTRTQRILENQISFELGIIPADLDTLNTAIDRLTLIARHADGTLDYEDATAKAGPFPFHPWAGLAIQSAVRAATINACLTGHIRSIYPEAISPDDTNEILTDALTILDVLRTVVQKKAR